MLAFDLQQLKKTVSDFYRLVPILIGLYDDQQHLLYQYPEELTPFCKQVRKDGKLHEKCLASDQYGLLQCRDTKKPFVYRCHMGLTEVVAPILDHNVIIGYLFLGQLLSQDAYEDVCRRIEDLPQNSPADRAMLSVLLTQITPVSDETLHAAEHILEMCACYLWINQIVSVRETTIQQYINHYIHDNLSSPDLTLESICRYAFLSRSALYSLSTRIFGMGITDYIRKCRIEQAKKLLCTGHMPIHEVACCCGFSTPNYFSKVFKNETGVLPKDYAKE